MNYNQIEFPLFAIAVVANIALSIVVLRYAPRNASRYLFGAFVVSQVFWIGTNFAAFAGNNFLWLARLTMLFAALHSFFFFLFIYTFLEQKKVLTAKLLVPLTSSLLIVIALTLSPLIFEKLEPNQLGELSPKVGPAMPFFGIFVGTCILLAFYSLIKKYRKSSGVEKLQWRYLSFGLALTFFLVLVYSFLGFVVLENLSTVKFGHLYTLPFLIFTTYAMVKHRLLNIKAILAELAVILLNIVIFVQLVNSESVRQLLVNGIVLMGTAITGYLVIKGVNTEIKHREELQKLTEELQVANKKLDELNKFKADMLSLAAHDIKRPLATIKGFASILIDGLYGPVTEKMKETLVKIKNSSDDLVTLVESLLNLRRAEEGYKFEPTKLNDLIAGVITELRPVAAEKKVELSFTSKDDLSANADAQKLKEAIKNIIDNALKYTPQGYVRVNLENDNGYALISITDSGLGIPSNLLSRLFGEEFVRDERFKHQIRGTGLGLYLTGKIITAHGGTIWAESAGEGKGSRFFVKLRKV